jgi:hypothetical protein
MPSYIFIEVGDDGKKVFNSFESVPDMFSWLKETYKELETTPQAPSESSQSSEEDILPEYDLLKVPRNYTQNLNLTASECAEFLTWFADTFCDDSSSNSNDKLQCIIRLVLDVPDFCFTSPLMTTEKISMPEKFKDYSPDIIIHHLNKLYGTELRNRCERINFSKNFILFDKLANLFSSKEIKLKGSNTIISQEIIPVYGIWLTIHDFATNTLTKRTVTQWSRPFISLNYRKISSGATSTDIIKSSEMYKEYREFIDTVAKVFNCEEMRKKMLATANTRFFAQEMKMCGLNTVRKSEGIFFKDLQKKVFVTGTNEKEKSDELVLEGFSFDDASEKYESL